MGLVGVGLLLLTSGCDLGSGPPPEAASIEPYLGIDQTATVGTAVPVPPAVRVLSRKGKPLSGREVVFSVVSGGGKLSSNVGITDREGIAAVGSWFLGTVAGPQNLQARVGQLLPLILTATATAADPSSLTIDGGDGQTGVVGSPLPVQPSVGVRDVYGNAVSGANVEFLVISGGGFVVRNQAETGSSGVADAGSWILGTSPGANTLSASLPGVPPVNFHATADPDVPGRITLLEGGGQTGTVGTALPLRPTLQVADRFGNPLPGIPVLFEITAGGGTVQGGSTTTGSGGVAIAGSWTLGTLAGPQTLSATVAGLEPLTVTATANPGPVASALAQGAGMQIATVGTAVMDPPRVRVEDAYGNPVPEVSVTFSLAGAPDLEASPGAIEGADALTNESGIASAGSWTLGTVVGPYSSKAEVVGLPNPVDFSAIALPDAPAVLEIRVGMNQAAPVGTLVPVNPSFWVGDQYRNGVPEVLLSFAILEGGGILSPAQAQTDSAGIARLEGWTLGPVPGLNRMLASVEGLDPVALEAVGLSAPPSAITRVEGNGEFAKVGAPVSIPPKVRVTDAAGEPVASVPVSFAVAYGGGSITGGEATTDSDGFASVGSWTLGTVAGLNTLTASTHGLPAVTFEARGLEGPPALMVIHQGNSQRVLVNTAVALPPSVQLRDAFGNPTDGVLVTFSVESGGGSVIGSPAMSDAEGVARVEGWTLGPDPGINELRASSPGVPDLLFEATGSAEGGFRIDLEFMTTIDPSQQSAFESAAARWEGIIVGDIPDYAGTLPQGGCQPVTEAGGIDDVKIYVTVGPIDGTGTILGRAGPCYYRIGGAIFPLTGIMDLDEADLADLQASGLLEDVIVHEMGHVLGIGTLWNASTNDFLSDPGTFDPYFNGPAARSAFDAAGGTARTGPKVPVENTGGPGTRDGHWRESVFNSELMTGWIEGGGVSNPLSAVTIASLADMGYTVNMNAADPYVLFNPLGAPGQRPTPDRIYIQELPPPTPIPVGGG